jgi:hypothetical protein
MKLKDEITRRDMLGFDWVAALSRLAVRRLAFPSRAPMEYKPGEEVEVSGEYRVLHVLLALIFNV